MTDLKLGYPATIKATGKVLIVVSITREIPPRTPTRYALMPEAKVFSPTFYGPPARLSWHTAEDLEAFEA